MMHSSRDRLEDGWWRRHSWVDRLWHSSTREVAERGIPVLFPENIVYIAGSRRPENIGELVCVWSGVIALLVGFRTKSDGAPRHPPQMNGATQPPWLSGVLT